MSFQYENFVSRGAEFEAERSARKGNGVPPVEPPGFFDPPGAPAASPTRKMAIEWFDDAATVALDDPSSPLIEDMLDEGALSVIYGDSNSGKTFIALDMAHAVATCREWNGKRTRRGLVVYVAAEGGRRITRRIAALRTRYQGEKPLFALIRYPIDLRSSDANLRELISLVQGAERQCGERCAWIIVDTLSRALAGGDENSPVDMGRIVQAADHIRAETSAHFTYVHHTGKDAARGARGHSLLRAATDTEIEVSSGEIRATKQRDMECCGEFGFSLVDVMLGEDVGGKAIKSAVVEWQAGAIAKKADKPIDTVPASQRLFMEVVAHAIDEAGERFIPSPEWPTVRAVSDEIVRGRYYARIAEKPKPGDTPEKLAERQRQAFNRAIKSNLDAKRLVAGLRNGERVLWLP